MVHCISLAAGERLLRLAEHFELVWATGWEEKANDYLPLLGLPELPSSPSTAPPASARPTGSSARSTSTRGPGVAWIDDSFDESCYEWARRGPPPPCWSRPNPHLGIEEAHTEALIAWARA